MDAEPPILPFVHSRVRRRHDGTAPDTVSDIGTRLRAHRRAANITLRQVAEKSGLTAAYLSQVETGRTTPSIASAKRIAAAYGLSLVGLLAEDDDRGDSIVLRREERRLLISARSGAVKELLVHRQGGKLLEPLYVVIPPGKGSDGQYDHAGEEFGFVLSGTLELNVEDKVHRIRKGDAFYLKSTRRHGFRNPNRRSRAIVLWVITPPSF